jgi:hypothetical protein
MTVLAALAATVGIATVAWAAGSDPRPAPQRAAAVAADVGSPPEQVNRAVAQVAARAGVPGSSVVVHRSGGPLEATAAVAALAAGDTAVIATVGPSSRAAAEQARGAELSPGTTWLLTP